MMQQRHKLVVSLSFSRRNLYILGAVAVLFISGLALYVSPVFGTPLFSGGVLGVATSTLPTPGAAMFDYFEVMDSCDYAFAGNDCVIARSEPSTSADVLARLRVGVVLRVGESVTAEGRTWYKVTFVHPLMYPDRVGKNWYVAAEYVRSFKDSGDFELTKETATTTKRIVVDVSAQMLYAYDGNTLFMQEPISTGLDFTPTPHGTFTVFKKTPSRFMQGPIPGVSEQVYDLPGVPWNLYFTSGGAVIHGA